MHSDLAQRAYAGLRSTNAKPPPYSPGSDPIENIWELLDNRVKQTEPTTRETIKARVAARVNCFPPKRLPSQLVHCFRERFFSRGSLRFA